MESSTPYRQTGLGTGAAPARRSDSVGAGRAGRATAPYRSLPVGRRRPRPSTALSHPLGTFAGMPLLEGLDPAQHQAVVSEAQPLCILAPAGSGKTRVLTRR
ncbi:MAG: UvrD-helicase domain-containing protein, partial [Actinomycetes bacterium]